MDGDAGRRRGHHRVRHGHRQARRALGLPRRGRRVARRLLPGGRAAPGATASRPRSSSSTAPRTSGCGASSPAGTSRSTSSRRCSTRCAARASGRPPTSCRTRPACPRPSWHRRWRGWRTRARCTCAPTARSWRRRRAAPADAVRAAAEAGGDAALVRPLARGHDARLRGDRRLPAGVHPVATSASRSSRRAGAATTARPDAWHAPPSDVPFPVGARVAHGQWGEGVVQRYDDDSMVVLFDEAGYKTLALEVVRERAILTAVRADRGLGGVSVLAAGRREDLGARCRARRRASRALSRPSDISSRSREQRVGLLAQALGRQLGVGEDERRAAVGHPAGVGALVVGGRVRIRDQDRREAVLGELEDRAAGAGDGGVGRGQRDPERRQVLEQDVVRAGRLRGPGSRGCRRRGRRGTARP